MIKKLTLLVAVVAISTSVFGQLSFGLKGGANFTNMKMSDGGGVNYDNTMNTGFMVGAFVGIGINEKLTFQPEVHYAQYGCKLNKEIFGDSYKFAMNYISIPIMVKYSFGAIILQAGPQIGFLLSAEVDGNDAIDLLELKKNDYGINVGAGYQLEKFGIEARYYLGMANLTGFSGSELKNNGIQILLSYRFK
jgi:hypothetical protein